VAVNNAGIPTQFFDCLEDTPGKESRPLIVVFEKFTVFVFKFRFSLEIVIIIYEIYLHACLLNGGHFDNQWAVGVVDDNVHPRKSDNLVQLVAPFVDVPVFWHKGPDFFAPFLYSLG
jgi:hypothetical protein